MRIHTCPVAITPQQPSIEDVQNANQQTGRGSWTRVVFQISRLATATFDTRFAIRHVYVHQKEKGGYEVRVQILRNSNLSLPLSPRRHFFSLPSVPHSLVFLLIFELQSIPDHFRFDISSLSLTVVFCALFSEFHIPIISIPSRSVTGL